VVRLSSELRGVTSISEACRKIAASVLGGLGLQRVWIGLVNKTGTAVEAVAYRGRGITGEPISLSEYGTRLPAEIAVSTGIQVSTWETDFPETQAAWLGSVVYVDTPIKIDSRVVGIIRCDNGISKKRPSDSSLRALTMLSDLLSSFIRYIDVQSRLDSFRSTFEILLNKLKVAAVVLHSSGIVEEVYGDIASIPGLQNTSLGMNLKELTEFLPDTQRLTIENAVYEKKDTEIETVPQRGGDIGTGFSLLHGESGEMTLVAADNTIRARLLKRVTLLENETDAIASLAADLTYEKDPREICQTMLRTLAEFYPDESITVLAAGEIPSSITPEKLVVQATSGSGYQSGAILPGATILVREEASGSGILSEAVRTRRVINVPDVIQSDIYIAGLPDTRSELAIPMISRGMVVGLIDLQSTEQNRFKGDDIRRLNNFVGFAAQSLETALQQTELINMARRDRLTGLHNMTFFEERYPEEFERAQRYEYSFSLIMVDIDDFKHYNDSFGHPMGNVLLQKVTHAMREALRDVDILVRYGGEEFVCILPLTDKQVSADIAERIRVKVLEANEGIPNSALQPRGCVSISLGVATFPIDSREKDELLEIADQRMYRAKRAGKNSVCCN
jgi:diguanylate cyclase (GGDEF)-like protein